TSREQAGRGLRTRWPPRRRARPDPVALVPDQLPRQRREPRPLPRAEAPTESAQAGLPGAGSGVRERAGRWARRRSSTTRQRRSPQVSEQTLPGDAKRGRESLPIPDRPYDGPVPFDAKDPEAKFPPIEPLRPPTGAPNVLVILLDDVGFGASSAFGGPCATPTA